MKALKSGRISLDEKAVEVINQIFRALKEESSYLKVSPSKLVSQIVCCFEEKYFEREKKELLSRLFDKRGYIKHLLQTADSPEELVARVAELHGKRDKSSKKRSSKSSEKPQSHILEGNK